MRKLTCLLALALAAGLMAGCVQPHGNRDWNGNPGRGYHQDGPPPHRDRNQIDRGPHQNGQPPQQQNGQPPQQDRPYQRHQPPRK